jgi:ABC-2 type transport system permease protein
MAAFFSASWSGWATLTDLDRGVIDRFLATPVSRASIVVSQVVRSGIIGMAKALILLAVALTLGARVSAGPAGWVVLLLAAALVSSVFSGVSHGIALIVRNEDTLIAVVSFYALPLTFLSSTLIAEELMPAWMQWASRFNPVNWAVEAARQAMVADTDWAAVAVWLGLLLGATAVTCAFATWAFQAYRRTL